MNAKNTLAGLLLVVGALFTSCEDPISVPSDFEEPQLVVDAWLTNTGESQTIRLSRTVDYFAGGAAPEVSGADIQVCNDRTNQCFTFTEEGEGEYIYTPPAGQTLGRVGDTYILQMEVDGNTFEAVTVSNRTTRIDSIQLEFEEESLILDEGIYAQMFAFDSLGRGDTYWIRAFKNGQLLNRPVENTIAWDATFDAGADVDGTYFIAPIRASINEIDDEGAFVPYESGDEIYVEVHSISQEAFRFLSIALEQIQNEGLFAVPLANARGNVTNTETGERILGVFNVAEVSSISRMVE
jgi:hypothetical protein